MIGKKKKENMIKINTLIMKMAIYDTKIKINEIQKRRQKRRRGKSKKEPKINK